MNETLFEAPTLFRNKHIQSYLASAGIRKRRFRKDNADMLSRSEQQTLTVADGTRLLADYAKHPQSQGLAIMFHGWEGSADSTYLLELSSVLWQSGFSIFRLNFRDHGDSHHMNEGLFHSCRLDEVVQAVAQVCQQIESGPVFLAGYSLGGNFALRVAQQLQYQTNRIKHVFAVCPVIDPAKSLKAIESAMWHYEFYFLMKWRRSLKLKKHFFPEQYNDAPVKGLRLLEMTAYLVEQYTDFADIDAYFAGYAIKGDYLSELSIDATIIACADDPVIPIDDFYDLNLAHNASLIINQQGGHCGMIDQFWGASWVARLINNKVNTIITT